MFSNWVWFLRVCLVCRMFCGWVCLLLMINRMLFILGRKFKSLLFLRIGGRLQIIMFGVSIFCNFVRILIIIVFWNSLVEFRLWVLFKFNVSFWFVCRKQFFGGMWLCKQFVIFVGLLIFKICDRFGVDRFMFNRIVCRFFICVKEIVRLDVIKFDLQFFVGVVIVMWFQLFLCIVSKSCVCSMLNCL